MTENVMVRMKQNLSILGLRNTYENIDEYLGNAINNKVSITEFLDLIFDREAKAKINRSVENQIKMAGFPARKTFELYDFEFQPNLDTDMIDDLRTLRFIGNSENVIFLGTPGVGKTHLAIALGISAIENKYSTYFISCHQLIQNLLKANHENRLEERLKQYAKYKVLIIDEIGYLPTNLEGANLFFFRCVQSLNIDARLPNLKFLILPVISDRLAHSQKHSAKLVFIELLPLSKSNGILVIFFD